MVGERPTIADVAREAGVSKGLVSFALNDRPGVSAETKTRILAVAKDLGFSPSLRARSLSSDRAFALGLVIARDPEIISGDPFFPAFIAGVESALAPVGQALVLSMVGDEASEITTYRQLASHARVDGVILSDLRRADPRIALVQSLGLKAVTLGHPDIPSALPAVSLDDGPGIQSAVAHLVELGHRRIAHVSGPSRMLHGSRRSASFAQALAGLDLQPGPIVETDYSAADGARATRDLLALADRPTAIVYANDPMAIAGLGIAQRAGFTVPGDLSITGFDGSEVGQYIHPALTTVTTEAQAWGRQAAEALLRVIAGETVDDIELTPATLVIRESSARPGTATIRSAM
ncbi:LacI family DNA-binding transcriptional regulator [Marisediminicola senii]|uniref:LacI family DNA-binding transcriptional regulator n=1 Tax=Marisediminicola senii TaxID=2711233 RepID=UPI0013EBBC3B|nr:LacI family DNA-binding transcriptional regulator [Marisediminicola senii]